MGVKVVDFYTECSKQSLELDDLICESGLTSWASFMNNQIGAACTIFPMHLNFLLCDTSGLRGVMLENYVYQYTILSILLIQILHAWSFLNQGFARLYPRCKSLLPSIST